jgi:LacI family transcriptional regulator
LFRGENSLQTGVAGAGYFLSLPEETRPTAVACVSDLIAVGAMNAAAAQGIVVGRDLAVTGYDDSDLAEYLNPPLTSVRQPMSRVGREIVRLLLARINQDDLADEGVLLEPRLVIRRSSAYKQEN